MNKNLFLALALCATLSSSLVVSSEYSANVSASAAQRGTILASKACEPAPVAPSLYIKWTTLEKHPLRVSTYVPGMQATLGDTFTPCVDAACAGVVAAGLGYAAYSNRATLARGGKSVASGVATAASATKSGLVSGANATPDLVKYGVGSAVSVAGKVGSVALYPVKEAFAHKTATAVGVAIPVALAVAAIKVEEGAKQATSKKS